MLIHLDASADTEFVGNFVFQKEVEALHVHFGRIELRVNRVEDRAGGKTISANLKLII